MVGGLFLSLHPMLSFIRQIRLGSRIFYPLL
jgi:hypothetical protein